MFELPDISYETLYIAASAFIAIIIWFEGIALRATEGKLPNSSFFHLGSIVHTIWFPFSLLCLYLLEFQSTAIIVPIVYCVYKIFGLFYGSTLLSQQGIPERPEDIVIPIKLVDYTQSFSLVFFILCAFVINFSTFNFKLPF